MTSTDPTEVGPAYGGTADAGVASSVGADDPAAGEIAGALDSEHRKIERVLGELTGSSDAETARLRWGGVVREILEHEMAERRVVLPAVEQLAPDQVADLRRDQNRLIDELGRYDALNADASPEQIRSAADLVLAHLRTMDEVLGPLLERLPADERTRLGEDLRQVKG